MNVFVLASLLTTVTSIVQKTPSTQPICQGISDTGPGGMFGYSITMSSGEGDYTWMAIGKPWDSSVHIYVSANPPPVPTTNTTGNVTLPTSTTPPDWKPLQMVYDTANGTFPARAISLFGHSLDMTNDGAWLAVGVPGRTYAPLSQTIALQSHSYSGSVKIYRRIDDPSVAIQQRQYRYMGEIPNPNTGRRFWDKFGSSVKFFTPEDGSKTYLLITADAGWDGASTNTTGSSPGEPGWPNPPTSDVSRAGIYVYHLLQPSTLVPPQGPIAAFNGIFRYVQFLPQQSTAPLGSIGIQMDVVEVPDASRRGMTSVVLMMRDYVIPPGVLNEEQYRVYCPSGACTYVVMDNLADITGKTTLNATGVVTFFVLDKTTGQFLRQKENMLSSFGFPLEPYADSNIINNGYGEGKWIRDTWFGGSVAVAWDRLYGRFVTAVGAPKDAQGVFTFFRPDNTSNSAVPKVLDSLKSGLKASISNVPAGDAWIPGQFITNPTYHRRSSFGSSLSFSPDGKFLILADPIGPAMSMGQGEVYLYYRRSKAETLVPSTYASVPLPPILSSTIPYSYDRIGQFMKSASSIVNQSSIQSDHFGKSLAVNKWWVLVSSPLDQCVYTFDLPYAIQTSDDLSPPKPLPTYTIVPDTPTSTPLPIESSGVWLYGVIAGAIAVVLVIPIVWVVVKRYHKKKVLEQMENEQTIETLRHTEDSLEQLNQAQTRGGTEEDLSVDHQAVASNETLLDDRMDNQV